MIKPFSIYRFLLLIFLFFGIQISTKAQISSPPKDTETYLTFDSVSNKIEKKYGIKLYYNRAWMEGKKFKASICDAEIDDFIYRIKKETNLNCIVLNSLNYILVPDKIKNYSGNKNKEGILVIGDENNVNKINEATVSGKITDSKTGLPLKNAIISTNKNGIFTKTDENGNYELKLPTGDYNLSITHPDFEEIVTAVKLVDNGIANFEFFEKSKTLSEIVVYSQAPTKNIISNQMSTVQINAKEIKGLPSFLGEKDVIKSMTLLPGVQSTGEFGTGLFVRGGSSDQNLILVEGVPLFNSAHLFGLTSVLNSNDVNSISLLKAGIPAKYGERVSSIMDIKLKNNAEKLTFNGGIGMLDSRLSVIAPLLKNKITLLVGGRTSYSNWLLHAMPDVELKNSSASFYDINALLSIKIDTKNNLTLFGYFSNDHFSFDKNTSYQYDNTLFSARYNHIFNEKLISTLSVGYSRYRSNIAEQDTAQLQNAYNLHMATDYYSGKLNINWTPTNKQSIDIGVNGVLYALEPGKLTPLGDISQVVEKNIHREKGMETAAYLSDDITFSEKISANIGIRATQFALLGKNDILVFDQNSPRSLSNITDTLHYTNNQVINRNTSIEPRFSLRFSTGKSSSVKISYNRISQFINLISNTMIMSPTDVYKLSSPNIKPLVSNQFAAGYFRNFKNNSIETSLEIYYKTLKNLIEYRNGTSIVLNDALDIDLINANGYSYGAELYVKKNTGNLTGWASYTYSRSLRHTTSLFEEDQINNNKYYASPSDIPHNLILNATYNFTRRWSFSMLFNYKTGKPVTLPELSYMYNDKQYVYYSERNKYRLPDYHRLDFSITYDESLRKTQRWKGSWTLSILNIYAQKNPYSIFYKYNEQKGTQFNRSFGLYNLYIIKYPIPTITYNFTF